MPVTPIYGLAYPDADDLGGDFPAVLADLAADVDAALGLVVPDSGVLTNLGLTPATGWNLLLNQHRTIGKILHFQFRFTRTGAAIVATSTSNITDSLCGTITTAAKRPAMPNWVGMFRTNDTGGGALINGPTGNITITSAHTSSDIATGDNVIIAGSYTYP